MTPELEREKLAALAEFAAGAGHEINNPLAVIFGRAQLLLRDESDPERRRELAIIQVQAQRIREMIADLMLFARPPQPEPREVDLQAVVAGALTALEAKAATTGARLERRGDVERLPVVVDPEQIQLAVRALVDNGLNAVDRGGTVAVEVRRDPTPAVVVRDDGPGLSDVERRHAFDPFFSGRQAGRGLGMGLCKAWRIATNHGGSLTTEPADRGATFVLLLPGRETASHAQAGMPGTSEATTQAAAPPGPGAGGR